jgi:uncharacterized DUF497 family protein
MKDKKPIRWSPEKNLELKRERGVSFEEILSAIEQGGLLLTLEHPNKQRYPNQRIWVVSLKGYAHMVPFVENDEEVFLKTIMPSRKATKQYLSEAGDD